MGARGKFRLRVGEVVFWDNGKGGTGLGCLSNVFRRDLEVVGGIMSLLRLREYGVIGGKSEGSGCGSTLGHSWIKATLKFLGGVEVMLI